MFLLIGLAILLALGYTQLPKTTKQMGGGCASFPAKFTNKGDDNAQCISAPANPPTPAYPPSKPATITGTQSPAQHSSEPLSDLPLYNPKDAPPVSIFSADRSVNTLAMNPNMVDGLPFNPVTGRAAGNTLAPEPIMYSAPTELESPAGADLSSSTVDYSD